MSDTEVIIDEKIKMEIKEPKRYKVIFVNDDSTPMDFVVHILESIFKHTSDTAKNLTMQIHEEGSAIVGVYSFEIAEQKAVEATKESREAGFPLQIAVEEE